MDSIVTPPLSAPSLNPRQAKTTPFATMKKQYFFRPRIPSVDSPNFLGDPWDAIANHAPLVAATQEGLNKRAFSDAARQDSPSVPSSMDLASSVPKYSRPNASRSFTFNIIGVIIFIKVSHKLLGGRGSTNSLALRVMLALSWRLKTRLAPWHAASLITFPPPTWRCTLPHTLEHFVPTLRMGITRFRDEVACRLPRGVPLRRRNFLLLAPRRATLFKPPRKMIFFCFRRPNRPPTPSIL